MNVKSFLDNLQSAGYWLEHCKKCGCNFDATEGQDLCHKCESDLKLSLEDQRERGKQCQCF